MAADGLSPLFRSVMPCDVHGIVPAQRARFVRVAYLVHVVMSESSSASIMHMLQSEYPFDIVCHLLCGIKVSSMYPWCVLSVSLRKDRPWNKRRTLFDVRMQAV